MRFNDYTVRFTTFTPKGTNLVVKERAFKTEVARTRFLDKLEAAGNLVEVRAYSDPQ